MTTEQKINNLKPNQEVIISQAKGIICHAERTSDGKFIKYVRTFANGSFEVFHKERF